MVESRRRNEELVQRIEALRRERHEQVQMVGPGFYDSFLPLPDARLRTFVRLILRNTHPVISDGVLSGRWAEEDIHDFVMLLLGMVFEGRAGFDAGDGGLRFFAPIGEPPTDAMREALRRVVEGARPHIRGEVLRALRRSPGER